MIHCFPAFSAQVAVPILESYLLTQSADVDVEWVAKKIFLIKLRHFMTIIMLLLLDFFLLIFCTLPANSNRHKVIVKFLIPFNWFFKLIIMTISQRLRVDIKFRKFP